MIIYLPGMTLLDCKDAIMKHSRPKLVSMKNLPFSDITRHMSTTCPNMAFIKGFLNLFMSEAPSKNCIDTMKIKGVTDYNITFSLILDMLSFGERGIEPESMGLDIYDNVSIPQVS